MKPLRKIGVVAALGGLLVSSWSFVNLLATSLPYQDAPKELLEAQARAMEAYRSSFYAGLFFLLAGLVILVLVKHK